MIVTALLGVLTVAQLLIVVELRAMRVRARLRYDQVLETLDTESGRRPSD